MPMGHGSTYTLTRSHLILDNAERRYILKVRDLPSEERPREKILARGPESLSMPELLATMLTTGTIKEGVLEMSSRIMKEYGEGSIMHSHNPSELAAHLGIPLGKAIQIVAMSEMGRRFFERNDASSPVIRTAEDLYEYVKEMGALPKEHLRGIYLNTRYKVIRDEIISIGTLDANIIHPREVFKPALEYSAAAVILAHNHPSDSLEPSESDREITKQLIEAGAILGIDLIDHVIVGKSGFASIPADYQI